MPDHITFAVREDARPTLPRAVPARPELAVLDADLQHPPEVIPRLLAAAERDGAEMELLVPVAGRAATAAS